MAVISPAYVDPLGTSAVPAGRVRVLCDNPSLNLVALLGEAAPKIEGGIGGWDLVERPRQVSMTLWQGVEPFKVTLPILLDGWTAKASQEPALRALLRVARGDDETQPGVVEVVGIPLPADQWVIEDIEFGDPILRVDDGARYRQPLTLGLREYIPPTYLQLRRGALQGTKGKTTTIRVKANDTPAKIAKRRGIRSWLVLRDLNVGVVTKANQKLKTGTKLRVPVSSSKSKKSRASRQHRSRAGD